MFLKVVRIARLTGAMVTNIQNVFYEEAPIKQALSYVSFCCA